MAFSHTIIRLNLVSGRLGCSRCNRSEVIPLADFCKQIPAGQIMGNLHPRFQCSFF
ncbi:hypothetical protein MtrunA17_Chr1g0185151 [Medicago truncatula]|uniref:Uncharacterized protein n=1 Tax=Medicago truncatula TaxID=3880 RepID=A0A396JPC7_MEDTR|nr:hypothetical protein MtrunA17_Chr1g0185151 [Medicago truncatula]